MPYSTLRELSIPDQKRTFNYSYAIWLGLSLTITCLYSLAQLTYGLTTDYAVQDDARQHVFWMWRLIDPSFFPNDLIADYFQSIAPAGYTFVYKTALFIGIQPFLLSKLLPTVLGAVTTVYSYRVCYQLLPIPFAGFVGSILLIQNFWLRGDLTSGVARTFAIPILMAFLYYLLRRSLIPCIVTVFLQTLFYPQFVFLMIGILILRLLRWQRGIKLSNHRIDYWIVGLGVGAALIGMLPFVIEQSAFSPVVTLEEARAMPEFSLLGRNRFFVEGLKNYWLYGSRTGLYRELLPLSVIGPILLPVLLLFRRYFSTARRVKNVDLLLNFTIVSLVMFFVAHALLFILHLPSRYVHNSAQIIGSLAGGLTVAILVDSLVKWVKQYRPRLLGYTTIALSGLVAIALFGIPHYYNDLQKNSYLIGEEPAIYNFLAQTPQDTLVAAMSLEADNIAFFTGRSVLTSREHSIPYHLGYYAKIAQRTSDLLIAQYSDNLDTTKQFIQKYGINYWLVDRRFERVPNQDESDILTQWLKQYQPAFTQVEQRLNQGAQPIFLSLKDSCTVVSTENSVMLDAQCILQQ